MKNKKTPTKSLIFLKSSVIALAIVFFVLVILLVFLKLNKGQKQEESSDCKSTQNILISGGIHQVIDSNKDIIIVTRPKYNVQELLTIDKKCGLVKSKVRLLIK